LCDRDVDVVTSESYPKLGVPIGVVKCYSSAATVAVGQKYQLLLLQSLDHESVVRRSTWLRL
jgi:hypothetical protein